MLLRPNYFVNRTIRCFCWSKSTMTKLLTHWGAMNWESLGNSIINEGLFSESQMKLGHHYDFMKVKHRVLGGKPRFNNRHKTLKQRNLFLISPGESTWHNSRDREIGAGYRQKKGQDLGNMLLLESVGGLFWVSWARADWSVHTKKWSFIKPNEGLI